MTAARADPTRRAALVWLVVPVAAVLYPAAMWLNWGRPFEDLELFNAVTVLPMVPMLLGPVAVGALIASRLPRHPFGWLLLAGGLLILITAVTGGYAYRTLGAGSPQPGSTLANWAGQWLAVPMWVLLSMMILLYPDGRLPSPRWRWFAALVLTVGGVYVVVAATEAWTHRHDVVEGVEQMLPFAGDTVTASLWPGYAAVLIATLSAVVVRYRRGDVVQRAQIRWLAFAALLAVVGTGMFGIEQLPDVVASVVGILMGAGLSVAIAISILRHRLFDIDVVISRSLVVAVLAGFIASVYVTVVVGVGRVVGVGDEASLTLKVVATAIVAVAFQPLRQRVRRWADRVVYGHRATPYEVLAGFSRQAASAGDEASLQRIAEVLAAGTGAQPATVWLRVGDRLRPMASSTNGSEGDLATLPLVDGELPELPASLVVDVRHDGELLGAVSLTKPRSEPPTRQDEELTVRLARGLALMLRNARLTAELREHLQALQASRSRLVRAQDEARRAIESELRAGAQQQLDELKTLLEQAQERSAESGAVRTAALLEQLEGEAHDANDTLRTLAQGIYPPLLEAEGLGAAVAAQAARSTLPVTVHATGLPRYPAEVEVAVYFSILEALQNAAKYARASSVHVRLEPRDDGLAFEIADDGTGFDPHHTSHGSGLTGITARLDTIHGTLHIRSRPGTGTRITGHVPTPSSEPVPAHHAPTTAAVPA